MTIGELIELLKAIFEVIAEYIGQLIGGNEDDDASDDTTAQA